MCSTPLVINAATEMGHSKSAESTILGELDKRMDKLNERVDGIEEKVDLILKLLQQKGK
jgi:hypothetical protein